MHWEDIIIPESKWFVGDEGKFYNALNFSHTDYIKYKKKAEYLMDENRGKFTLKNMSEKLDDKLKKVNKAPSIKLPKLKKVTEEISE